MLSHPAKIVALALGALFSAATLAEEGPVWFWYEKCGATHLNLEVLMEGKVVLKSTIGTCHRDRWKAAEPAEQKHLTVKFVTSRDTSWEDYSEGLRTKAGTELELDMWQAGADPDAVVVGVSISSPTQIYLNTIHVAFARRSAESEVARGIVIRTIPINKNGKSR